MASPFRTFGSPFLAATPLRGCASIYFVCRRMIIATPNDSSAVAPLNRGRASRRRSREKKVIAIGKAKPFRTSERHSRRQQSSAMLHSRDPSRQVHPFIPSACCFTPLRPAACRQSCLQADKDSLAALFIVSQMYNNATTFRDYFSIVRSCRKTAWR